MFNTLTTTKFKATIGDYQTANFTFNPAHEWRRGGTLAGFFTKEDSLSAYSLDLICDALEFGFGCHNGVTLEVVS